MYYLKFVIFPLNNDTIVYAIAPVASKIIPNSAKPMEIIIKFVDTYLVDENKSTALYIKKEEKIKNTNPGIP